MNNTYQKLVVEGLIEAALEMVRSEPDNFRQVEDYPSSHNSFYDRRAVKYVLGVGDDIWSLFEFAKTKQGQKYWEDKYPLDKDGTTSFNRLDVEDKQYVLSLITPIQACD